MAPKKAVEFTWADDEIQLVLEATIDYKAKND